MNAALFTLLALLSTSPTEVTVTDTSLPPPVMTTTLPTLGLRGGLRLTPVAALTPLSAYGHVMTVTDGAWVAVDVAPSVRVLSWLSAELAVSALVPVAAPLGFPDLRATLTPAVVFDVGPVYLRGGVPLAMTTRGFTVGQQLALGGRFLEHLYAGVVVDVYGRDLFVGAGLEVGGFFDLPRF